MSFGGKERRIKQQLACGEAVLTEVSQVMGELGYSGHGEFDVFLSRLRLKDGWINKETLQSLGFWPPPVVLVTVGDLLLQPAEMQELRTFDVYSTGREDRLRLTNDWLLRVNRSLVEAYLDGDRDRPSLRTWFILQGSSEDRYFVDQSGGGTCCLGVFISRKGSYERRLDLEVRQAPLYLPRGWAGVISGQGLRATSHQLQERRQREAGNIANQENCGLVLSGQAEERLADYQRLSTQPRDLLAALKGRFFSFPAPEFIVSSGGEKRQAIRLAVVRWQRGGEERAFPTRVEWDEGILQVSVTGFRWPKVRRGRVVPFDPFADGDWEMSLRVGLSASGSFQMSLERYQSGWEAVSGVSLDLLQRRGEDFILPLLAALELPDQRFVRRRD
ncbi:hypothetical protein ACFLZP_04595 [Patescibacteria group bacterium]